MRELRPKAIMTGLFALLFAASFLLLLPGCQNPLAPQRANQATGTVLLSIGGDSVARTIMPDAALTAADFDLFVISWYREDGGLGYGDDEWTSGSTFALDLAVGTWNILINAMRNDDTGAPVIYAAWGRAQVTVEAGQNIPLPIVLNPIQDSGHGTFAWEITLPADVTARMRITGNQYPYAVVRDWAALTIVDGIASGYAADIPAGNHLAVFELTLNNETVSMVEVLQIFSTLTSRFVREIAVQDFPQSLIGIMADAWDGTGFVDAYGVPLGINHVHFSALGVRGVIFANFNYILPLFSGFIGNDLPDTLPDLKALVDAALIDILGRTADFAFAGSHDDREDVEAKIRAHLYNIGNNTPIADADFDWEDGAAAWPYADTLTVTIGGHDVEIVFTMVAAEVVTVSIYPDDPIIFTVDVSDPVRLEAVLETTPPNSIFTVTWISTDPSVIFTDGTGASIPEPVTGIFVYVVGLDTGGANVYAEAGGVTSDPIEVTVSVATALDISITYSDPLDIEVGDRVDLTAVYTPSHPEATFDVLWTVDSPGVRFLGSGDTLVETVTTTAVPHTVTIVGVSGVAGAAVTAAAGGNQYSVYVDVEAAVIEPTVVPFTWQFGATPVIPGWNIVEGTNPDGAANTANLSDTRAVFVNNMVLRGDLRTMGWTPAANRGITPDTADANAGAVVFPDSVPGRIQVLGASGDNPFLTIYGVRTPFTLEVDVAGTGNTDTGRGARLFVGDSAIGAHDFVTRATRTQAVERGSFTVQGDGEYVDISLRAFGGAIRIYRIHLSEPADDCDYCNAAPCECQDIVDAAAADALAAVNTITATNLTTAETIMGMVMDAVDGTITVPPIWQVAFALQAATDAAPGAVTGAIRLTLGTHFADVPVNLSIAQLPFNMNAITGLQASGGPVFMRQGEYLRITQRANSWYAIDTEFDELAVAIDDDALYAVIVTGSLLSAGTAVLQFPLDGAPHDVGIASQAVGAGGNFRLQAIVPGAHINGDQRVIFYIHETVDAHANIRLTAGANIEILVTAFVLQRLEAGGTLGDHYEVFLPLDGVLPPSFGPIPGCDATNDWICNCVVGSIGTVSDLVTLTHFVPQPAWLATDVFAGPVHAANDVGAVPFASVQNWGGATGQSQWVLTGADNDVVAIRVNAADDNRGLGIQNLGLAVGDTITVTGRMGSGGSAGVFIGSGDWGAISETGAIAPNTVFTRSGTVPTEAWASATRIDVRAVNPVGGADFFYIYNITVVRPMCVCDDTCDNATCICTECDTLDCACTPPTTMTWAELLADFIAYGGDHGDLTVTVEANGIVVDGRTAGGNGIGLNVVALREFAGYGDIAIIVTVQGHTAGWGPRIDFWVNGDSGDDLPNHIGSDTGVTILASNDGIPAGDAHRIIVNGSDATGFTITDITVGGHSIIDND